MWGKVKKVLRLLTEHYQDGKVCCSYDSKNPRIFPEEIIACHTYQVTVIGN